MSLPRINVTLMPNVILDKWMAILSGAEFKVLNAVCRKTYGWHKEKDRISIPQIIRLTNLSRQGVINSLNKLVQIGLILKQPNKNEKGGDISNFYEINLEKETTGVNSVYRGESTECTRGSQLSVPGGVNSVYPQKKLITKETNTKEKIKEKPIPKDKPSPFALKLLTAFIESLSKHLPEVTRTTKESEAKSFDQLLKLGYSEDEIRKVINFSHTDGFWSQHVITPHYLKIKFEKLLLALKRNGQTTQRKSGAVHFNQDYEEQAKRMGIKVEGFDE